MNDIKKLLIVFLASMCTLTGISQSKSEAKMGEKQLKMLKLTYGFYDNPGLLAVVVEVGQNLEKHLGLEYKLKYHLIDMEEPNAFATSGGYVYVTRGLLALINTKDELAGVLGHELSHVTQKHNSKKMYVNILPAILEVPANIIGLLTYPEVGELLNLPIEAITGVGTASFSRKMESNADKLGIEVATKAGYDPYALGDILTRLNDFVEYLTQEEMKKSIFIDHPMTPKRVKKINELNMKKGFEYKKPYPGTTIGEINGLVYGQNPVGGIIMDSAFIHPELELYCEFPTKWQVNNSPQSISALSQDRKAVVMITMEKSSYINDLVNNEIKKHTDCTVIEQGEKEINGLEAYHLILNTQDRKQADKKLEVMWLRLEKNQVLIKVQAVSTLNDFPKNAIEKFFGTIRMTTAADFDQFTYNTIELKKEADIEEESIQPNQELLKIINGIDSDTAVPLDRFKKLVKKNKLSNI